MSNKILRALRRHPERYTVLIEGVESGHRTEPLTFLTFDSEEEAEHWVAERPAYPETRWVVVPLRGGS